MWKKLQWEFCWHLVFHDCIYTFLQNDLSCNRCYNHAISLSMCNYTDLKMSKLTYFSRHGLHFVRIRTCLCLTAFFHIHFVNVWMMELIAYYELIWNYGSICDDHIWSTNLLIDHQLHLRHLIYDYCHQNFLPIATEDSEPCSKLLQSSKGFVPGDWTNFSNKPFAN